MAKVIVKGVVSNGEAIPNQFSVGAKWKRDDGWYGVWGYTNLFWLFPAILYVLDISIVGWHVLPQLSLELGKTSGSLFDWRGRDAKHK